MGRQEYLIRLALGRSPYESLETDGHPDIPAEPDQTLTEQVREQSGQLEPREVKSLEQSSDVYVQQFDDRGYPQNLDSQALSRLSRRAQNDVLATVGVILGPDHDIHDATIVPTRASGIHKKELFQQTQEDAAEGTKIAFTHMCMSDYTLGRMTYMRNRLQTFRFYSGVPLLEILKIEYETSGPLLLLFGGLPGVVMALFFNSTFHPRLARWFFEEVLIRRIDPIKSPTVKLLLKLSAATLISCVRLSVITSLYFRSKLQGLGLLPFRPFFPDLMALIPFTSASLIQPIPLPADLTITAVLQFLASLTTSPVVLYFAFHTIKDAIRKTLFKYITHVLPKPDNPDSASLQVALGREDGSLVLPGFGYRYTARSRLVILRENDTVREMASQDWATFSNHIASVVVWWRCFLMRHGYTISGRSHTEKLNSEWQPDLAPLPPPEPIQEQPMPECASNSWISPLEDSPNSTYIELSIPIVQPQETVVGDSGNTTSEWSAVAQNSTISFSEVHDDSKPTHRVTLLTSYMASFMAVNLSSICAQVLVLPLETLFVRSIVLAYSNTAGGASQSSLWLCNETYPLGSWFGMGLKSGRAMDYARKMTLCFGLEVAFGYGIWQIGAGVAWWYGKTRHAWGRL
ncbi:MAG: hypothetical protein Q9170_000093 [Blastenia crenularia]